MNFTRLKAQIVDQKVKGKAREIVDRFVAFCRRLGGSVSREEDGVYTCFLPERRELSFWVSNAPREKRAKLRIYHPGDPPFEVSDLRGVYVEHEVGGSLLHADAEHGVFTFQSTAYYPTRKVSLRLIDEDYLAIALR